MEVVFGSDTRHAHMELAELPLREVRVDPPAHWHSQKRATLADLRKELQRGEVKVRPRYDHLAILSVYTLIRIFANLLVLDFYATHVWSAVARPVITGLGVYIFISPRSRYSPKLRLHVLSWRVILCLSAFLFDESMIAFVFFVDVVASYYPGRIYFPCYVFWVITCNVLQVYMTTLKIRALGWHRAARCCDVLVIWGCGFVALFFPLEVAEFSIISSLVLPAGLLCSFATIFLQAVSLLKAACKATGQACQRSDGAMVWTAFCLVANAILMVVGPALSWSGFVSFYMRLVSVAIGEENAMKAKSRPQVSVTIDVCFQVLNSLLLSGMIGAQSFDLKQFRRLAEVSGFGFASERIAFPGKINPAAKDCIVSFPGKYSKEWDEAVEAVKEETSACSLACVFLTDTASGLGQHANLPNKPEECWCHTIYGEFPPSTYLNIVDVSELKPNEVEAEVLAFKDQDAKAMGQILLIKRDQTELQWEIELAEALVYAEQACHENKGRAPWGCMWFEEWRKKVGEAVLLKQRLHVFYFADSVGKGHVDWHQLCDTQATERARKDTGLGASQTAEVAYLKKEGIPFQEQDITDFKRLIAPTALPQEEYIPHQCEICCEMPSQKLSRGSVVVDCRPPVESCVGENRGCSGVHGSHGGIGKAHVLLHEVDGPHFLRYSHFFDFIWHKHRINQ